MPSPAPYATESRAQSLHATKPTLLTRYIRTCIPWQMIRFARINLKMFRVIFKSH
nr:hypothetical protein [uncultured Holophaga sp.]